LQPGRGGADDPIVPRSNFSRADALLLATWIVLLAGFVALAVAAHDEHPLPYDERVTLWVQGLERVPCTAEFAEFANVAGDGTRVVLLVTLLAGFLLLRGMRFEALIVAGVVAMRGLQLAIRHTIEWPAGQAESFLTTRTLPDGGSFPSGHVLGEVLAYGLLFWLAPRIFSSRFVVLAIRIFCALVVVLGGPARLYVGAHWPSDVIGSMLLAALYLLPALWLDARRSRSASSPSLLGQGPGVRFRGHTPTISRPASSTSGTSDRSPTTSV
jgi:undecaprenyl-diphosphatase